ncbi:PDZ domain-containing protein [Desulfofundulus thermobenzoicus]|uniref:PDZ domain-containing protein n=1 Tax=Desulfofundulus thermobenzoicus TaxID=29376 RepID=A0A6N7IQM9_9FIRM|nr:PDZ domain-containing protein [Desulfofundulus thermobenzoicus]HHW43274.1 PDZ domain-containing protein [Desulfotomaculum sp.]
MHKWKRTLLFVALAAFVAGVMFAGGCLLVNDFSGQKGQVPGSQVAAAMPGVGPGTVADIVDKAGPAVVKIDTYTVSQGRRVDPFFDDPFFRQFFGSPFGFQTQPREEHGLGSGFIISQDGYILTNDHVVDGAQRVTVTIQGFDKPLPARVIGADYDLDLAVVKVDAGKPLSTLQMGDSDKVRVGEWVIAIGNPFGLDHTVTVGVISAKGRPVQVENRRYKNLLQTDASINPGNSGGPLLNLNGEVVGINTAVAQAQGIGFAIPTSTVKEVLDQLMNEKQNQRPWLGVQMQPVTEEIAAYLGLPEASGALVAGVIPGSPAANAGLAQGDVILQVNGQKVNNPDELAKLIQESKVGQRMVLQIFRKGNIRQVPMTLAEKPPQLR